MIVKNENIDAFVMIPMQWYGLGWYVEQGLVMDITELFPTYASNYYEQLNPEILNSVSLNERIYSVPPYMMSSNKLYTI